MKLIFTSACLVFVLTAFAFGQVKEIGAAQDTKISQEEFDRVRALNQTFLAKESYRIRYTHETFPYEDAKEPEKISVWMTEFLPPDREHNFYGLGSTKAEDKYERIVAKDRIFTNRGGKWTELEKPSSGFGLSSGASSLEYFIRGSEMLGKVDTTIYELISGFKFAFGSGPWQTSFYRSRYWISKDGRIRKYVGESDGLSAKRSRTTEIYEYDPKIKIEVPIK